MSDTIAFHYLKSSAFRVVHADGAVSGITPNGNLHLALFSERAAIPQRVVNMLRADGSLGDEIPEEGFSRGGIVRELEVDAFFSLATAKLLRDLLNKQIAIFEAEAAAHAAAKK